MEEKEDKLAAARRKIGKLQHAIVAFSGGVDSTLVAKICHDELGGNALAVTAISPSYPRYELEQAEKTAKAIGIRHVTVTTKEMEKKEYRDNTPARCYFCKTTLYQELNEVARRTGYKNILNGINADDAHDYRPGMKASTEFNVLSPLKDAGITKSEIVEIAKSLGLPNWNKPASPCLSSRVPYGTAITDKILGKIEKAEEALRELGIRQFRVRYHKEIARIEVNKEDFLIVLENAERISRTFREIGFAYACLDIRGFKSGNLNEMIADETRENKSIALR